MSAPDAFRVLAGDCLRLLAAEPDGSVDTVITDPPYGIAFQSRSIATPGDRLPKIANDAHPFIWWLWDAARITKLGGGLLCFCRWDVREAFRQAIGWAGWTLRSEVIWDRDWHGMGDLAAGFSPQHDTIWWATKGAYSFPGTRPVSVIRVPRVHHNLLTHPNEKPVALLEQLVQAVTPRGGLVCDPFAGSGTTGEAALRWGYRFLGMELDPAYAAATAARCQSTVPYRR